MNPPKANSIDLSQIAAQIGQWPILKPVNALLHSRSFVVLVLSIVANMIVPQLPGLSAARAELIGNAIFYGGGIMLTGLQLQNLIEARNAAPKTPQDAILQMAGELANVVATPAVPFQPPITGQAG